LLRLSEAFAIRMRAAGIDRTSTLCLDSADMSVILAMVFASAHLGAQFVQQSGDLDMSTVLPVTHWLRDHDDSNRAENIVIDATWSPAEVEAEYPEPDTFGGYADPEDPWLIVHTSGTTGYPKFLALSQRLIHDRSMAVVDEYGGGETRLCSLFSPTSYPFLSRALGALLHGSTLIASRDPAQWAEAGVTLVSTSTVIAASVLSDVVLASKLPMIEVLGSKIDTDLALHLLASFDQIDHSYGATETNRSFSNRLSLADDGSVRTVGRPRDSEIQIVDADDKLCPQGAEGVVRVKNAYLASGYLTDSQAEKMAFRDGWFYPGDIAKWGREGAFLVQRRDDDVINIGGQKVHALAVDRLFTGVDGIADAVCFKNPKPGARDELFAFVVYAERVNKLQAQASAKYACEEALGKALVPRVIREVQGIPRKSNGYPDRAACAKQVLEMSRKIQAGD
jgi:acyl-coenzyme A synthetase/AMP-(fatty) acid ligase